MSDAFVSGVLGALCGLGLLVAWLGSTGHRLFAAGGDGRSRRWSEVDRIALRISLGLGGAIAVGLMTRWIAAVAVAGVGGFLIPGLSTARGHHRRELAKVEALATWIEQVRDTLSAANGLEHAISATARLAPPEIAGAVERLAGRLAYENSALAFRRFADEVDHPLADFVVAALVSATQYQAREITPLLGELSIAARAEAAMRTRVWVGRARTRTAVRVIGIVIVAVIAGLRLIDPGYMSAYSAAVGQFVLCGVAAMFIGSLVAMDRMGRIALPQRFIARRDLDGLTS